VHWYNHEHRHSGIGYVTPAQRHAGQDGALLASRHELYQQARHANPRRWSGKTRDWTPVGAVTLNPERDPVIQTVVSQTQLSGSIGEPALVRSSRPKRPDLRWQGRGAQRRGWEGRPGATRSAPRRACMARMASTGPSPE
jgi:hypothetical protein